MASVKKNKGSKKKGVSSAPRKTVKVGSAFLSKGKVLSRVPRSPNEGGVYFLLTGLVLTVAGTLSLPNFHLHLPPGSWIAQLLVHPSLLIFGFACLVYSFRLLPDNVERSDMPRWQAYPLFVLFFALCLFWRFYRPDEPSAPFWFDNQVVTGDIAAIVDSGYHPLLFPWGQREAFFPYFSAAVWKMLTPDPGGVVLIRLSCTLIDLMAIWALYLLGRTMGGRRLGIILMAFWSVSLPMTIWNYFGMGQNTAALAAILSLLFFFRLLQKPTLRRFLYWGLALGFGGYCYVPFRPWPPAMITLVLVWVLLGSKEKLKGAVAWFLAAGVWVSWIFLFFLKNSYLPEGSSIVSTIRQPWFLILWALLLLGAFLKTRMESGKSEVRRRLTGWAIGVVVLALFMAPLYLYPAYAQHTNASSVFNNDNGQPLPAAQAIHDFVHNIFFFFAMMFGQPHEDVSRYPLPGQSYFEIFPELCMVIGLAYFAARPTWNRAVIFIMALVGMTPFIFSNHAHPGRVETIIAPLFLMGGIGLQALWGYFRRESKNGVVPAGVLVALLLLWAWGSNRTFWDIRDWMANMSNDNIIGHQLNKDWKQYRVIMERHYPEFVMDDMTVLCDQKEAYLLANPNPLYLEQGQSSKDIAFYMYGSTRYNQALEERVKQDFPQAQWNVIECRNPEIPHFMLRAVIPFSALSETPGKIFYIQRVPHEYWRRRFYWKDYGVARGMVWWDERVPELNAGFPPGMNEFFTARAEGEFSAPVEGDYTFSVKPTIEVVVLSVDGKTLFALRHQPETAPQAEERIHLKAGNHQVTYLATFRRAPHFQDVTVTPPGGGRAWILGQAPSDGKP